MGKYKKCPRCELNYILQEEDLCPICKAELKLAPAEDDNDLELCSICGKNLITVDQVMCDECAKKRSSIDDVVDDSEPDDDDKPFNDWDELSPEQEALDSEEPVDEQPLDTPDGFTDIDDMEDFSDDDDDEEEEDDEYHGPSVDDDFEDIGNIDDVDDYDDDDDDNKDDDYDDEDFLSSMKKKKK